MKPMATQILVTLVTALLAVGCADSDDVNPVPTTDTSGSDVTTTPDVPTTPDSTPDAGPIDDDTTVEEDTGSGEIIPDPVDDQDSFETALLVEMDSYTAGQLSPTGDMDYYRFEGTAGQAVLVFLEAQQAPFDVYTIDTVVTMYDAGFNQLAENDDPFPRTTNDSAIYTLLPADGTYYIRVTECWTWVVGTAFACAEPMDKFQTNYGLYVSSIDAEEEDGTVLDSEAGDTAAEATPLTHSKNTQGQYFLTVVYGTFFSEMDVDVYSFTYPEDVSIDAGQRHTGGLAFYPDGPSGNGSTSPIGPTYITTAAEPDVMIAYTDGISGADLSAPLTPGTAYLFWVSHPGMTAGTNDFYFANHDVGGSNPIEADEPGNDTVEGAELLTGQVNDNGGTSYFVGGDVIPAPGDVDNFAVIVPLSSTGASEVSIICGAQRSGSGLRDFSFTLLDDLGTALPGTAKTETMFADAELTSWSIPTGTNSLIFQVTAGAQAEDVTSSFYRCGIHVYPQ